MAGQFKLQTQTTKMNGVTRFFYSLLNYRKAGQLGTADERHRVNTIFLLCGIYCLVAILFLCFFGFKALLDGDGSYGRILLGFAASTAIFYTLIWLSGIYILANHLVTILMGSLCLYLLYTGGESNTGPLWYFVFPLIAMFLQGTRKGSVSIIILFLFSAILILFEELGMTPTAYTTAFLQRMAAVYIAVSAMGFLFAWFRDEAENSLKENNRQLAALSGYDQLTGLNNRRRAETMLETEARKYFRYGIRFSLILMKIEKLDEINARLGKHFGDYAMQEIAMLLKKEVRHVDTLSRWDSDMFSILLPSTLLLGAAKQAERIRIQVTKQRPKLEGERLTLAISCGVCEFTGIHTSRFIHNIQEQLDFALATGGNCVMFPDVVPDLRKTAKHHT